MKKKIIIIVIIVFTMALIVGIFIGIRNRNNSGTPFNTKYEIPSDYISKISDDKSHVDGANTNYYIYNNKIIVEKISHYPVGHPNGTDRIEKIIEYRDIDTKNAKDITSVKALLKDKKGTVMVAAGGTTID